MHPKVAIIGAGVSGLTCGVVLAEHGYRTAIFAKDIGQQTTSSVAAAVWFPYHVEPAERVIPLALETYQVLLDLALERFHLAKVSLRPRVRQNATKATIRCKNLPANTLIRGTLFEIEVKLLYAIRGASRREICLADSEAQGSAVRQSLCADCQSAKLA